MILRILLSMAFFAAVGGWGAGKLLSDGASTGNAAAPQPALSATPAATPTLPAPTAVEDTPTATPQSPSPSPATGVVSTPAASTPAAVSTTVPASSSTPRSDADEIAQQHTLERLGRTYLLAIQHDDSAALRSMLAARCAGADVPALLARRGTEISVAAGVAIEEITPLDQFVGHIDIGAGEAHTVLQFTAKGAPAQLFTSDGWLLEGGVWKSANC